MSRKDYSRAVLEFRNAVSATPHNPEAHYQLAVALFENGDYQNALASVSKTLQLDSAHTPARILQAQLLAASPDASMVAQAEKVAESVVAGTPDPAAFDTLALAEMRLGKLDDAEKHLHEALDRFPASLSLYVKLAVLRLQQKDFAGAEQVLRDAVAKDRNSAAPALALGNVLLLRGNVRGAEEAFRDALKAAPSSGAALFYLAAVQHRQGHRADAVETLRRLAEVPDPAYRPLRAVYLFQRGAHKEAIVEFERLYQAQNADGRALADLVTAYAIVGRFRDATEVLKRELQKNPSNVDALLLRARIYLHIGDLDKAEADLLPAFSSGYQSGEAHYLQAAVFAARGQTRRRRAELAEALKADPRHVRARLELCQLLLAANSYAAAASLLDEIAPDQRALPAVGLQQNWIRLARNEQRQAEKDLDVLLANDRTPDAVLQKAALAFWRKEYRAAGELAIEVLRRKPGDVRALELVFKLYAAQNQTAAGIQKLKEYAAAAGKSAEAQFFVGAVLRSAGDRAGARGAFANALQINPDFHRAQTELAVLDREAGQPEQARQRLVAASAKNDPTAILMLADLDYQSGKMEEALAGYRKVVEIDSDNVTALNNLAFLTLERSHDPDAAMELILEAKRLDPANPSVNDTLGWVQFQKGSYRAAVTSLEQAVSREPTASRLYHLATAQFKLGNRAQALQIFEKAYKLDPNRPEAKAAMTAASQR